VYPLCALRSLDRLAFSSYLGVAAILYTAAFSVWRALDGSYASGGALHRPPPPAAAEVGAWTVTPNTLVLVANLGVALCAHFSAPQFYRALAGATPSRFAAMAYAAFGAVLALSLAIMFAGHATFGGAAAPLVLDSYHPTADAGATAARVATVASLGCSFPLIFSAPRSRSAAPASRRAPPRGGPPRSRCRRSRSPSRSPPRTSASSSASSARSSAAPSSTSLPPRCTSRRPAAAAAAASPTSPSSCTASRR